MYQTNSNQKLVRVTLHTLRQRNFIITKGANQEDTVIINIYIPRLEMKE